jgi:hypothetical protein
MSPETLTFLDSVRDAEDPTPEREAKVLARVRASVALGALASVSAGGSRLLEWLLSGLKTGLFVAVAALPSSEAPPLAPSIPVPLLETPLPRTIRHASVPQTSTTSAVLPDPPASSKRATSPAPARTPSLRHELELLTRVQGAMRSGDPDEALRLLARHRTSDRQLLAEREAARILALCAAGRTEAAAEAASQFLIRHPASPQRAAVERSCGAGTPR